MKKLQNLNTFISDNKNKNIFSALKNIHGVNHKKISKISLATGFDNFEKVNSMNLDIFLLIKAQVSFFYNLEENNL